MFSKLNFINTYPCNYFQAPVFNDATRSVLEDIFLLKRLTTMQEFFSLCGQVARGVTSVYDDDHLNKPIRRFTADYVSRQLLGVTSQTLALALCLLLHRIGLNVTGNSFLFKI
jgi:PI-3-kinase-related kinase SMG-1